MKAAFLSLATVALLLLVAGPAQAGLPGLTGSVGGYFEGPDPIYTFSYNDGINIASGTLDVTGNLATSGTLNLTAGAATGTYALLPGGPGETLSPFGAFLFDNLINPSANPSLDGDGLLFGAG